MGVPRSLKIKLRMVFFITLGWLLYAVYHIVYNHLFYHSSQEDYFEYDLQTIILTNLVVIPIAGLLGGFMIVFLLKDRFRRKPFGISILIYFLTIIFLIVGLSYPAAYVYNSLALNTSVFDPRVGQRASDFYFSYGFLINLWIWTAISTATIIILNVNDKYGQGVLLNLLIGRYHKPKREARIFMFLDIKSSTSIAEQLGDKKYFRLLNEFYNNITLAIVNTYGEIYQYVGDEIVITWKMKDGMREARCIRCFFEVEKIIYRLSQKYLKVFGIRPDFKAGLHYGIVTTGEVAVVKKEIVFSGDVLNTTSRIQETCNKFGAKLLISKSLIDKMLLPEIYEACEIGEIQLRGRQKPVTLYTVSQKTISRTSPSLNYQDEPA